MLRRWCDDHLVVSVIVIGTACMLGAAAVSLAGVAALSRWSEGGEQPELVVDPPAGLRR